MFKGDGDEETQALADITVDIGRGEYVSVSAPSGCGKSTFLAILALLNTPSAGRYWLNGRATDRLSPADKARVRNLDVGLIFQSSTAGWPIARRAKMCSEMITRPP